MEVKGTPNERPRIILCIERSHSTWLGAVPCGDTIPMAATPPSQVKSLPHFHLISMLLQTFNTFLRTPLLYWIAACAI